MKRLSIVLVLLAACDKKAPEPTAQPKDNEEVVLIHVTGMT